MVPPLAHRSRAAGFAALVTSVALAAAACGPATPQLSDPVEILREGAASLAQLRSFHLRAAIDGEVPLDLGGAGGGSGAPIPLDGMSLEGDVDVAAGELAVELLAPSLLNLRVNVVVANGVAYLKAPFITGRRWIRQPAEGGVAGDPGAALEGLSAFLARPELGPERLADVRCAGTDCYRVRLVVPAPAVREALGWLGEAVPGLAGDAVGDVTVTADVRKDSRRLATLGLEIPAGGSQPLSILLEVSRPDEPVTIEAPPPGEVDPAPGG